MTSDDILKCSEIKPDEEKLEIPSGRSNPDEIEFSSKEDSINIYKIASNVTALIVEVPAIIDKGSLLHQGKGNEQYHY